MKRSDSHKIVPENASATLKKKCNRCVNTQQNYDCSPHLDGRLVFREISKAFNSASRDNSIFRLLQCKIYGKLPASIISCLITAINEMLLTHF